MAQPSLPVVSENDPPGPVAVTVRPALAAPSRLTTLTAMYAELALRTLLGGVSTVSETTGGTEPMLGHVTATCTPTLGYVTMLPPSQAL